MEKIGQEKVVEKGSVANQSPRINILDIGPNSSPAEIELNERWSRLSHKELVEIVSDGFLCYLAKQPIVGYEDLQEKQGYWWLSVLRNVFVARSNDLGCDNRRDFNVCLRCIYLCSLFAKTGSKFHFPKINKKIWEEIMEDWWADLPNDEPNQKILTFFMNRYFQAGLEEQKIMLDIFRQRIMDTRYENVEAWVKWLNDPAHFNPAFFQSEMGRRFAMARASNGGWSLMLQDIRGGELLRALNRQEGFPVHLTMALKETGDQIVDIDSAVKVLVEELTKLFSLDQERQERIEYIIYDTTFVAINIFCVCFYEPQIKEGRDCHKMANSIRTWLKWKEYMTEEDEIFLSGHKVSLLLQFNDVQGYSMFRKHLDKDREKG